MAIGDQSDVFNRLKSVVPRWFGDTAPVRDALLQGFAQAGSFIYSLYAYSKLQTRIKTATDGWLDMIAADFFGTWLLRKAGQSDAVFRNWIIVNLLRERATRYSIQKVLQDLTGRAPVISEPLRPLDTGGYGVGGVGYGVGTATYGSMAVGPYQAWVIAYRVNGAGIPYVAGYSVPTGGYSQASRAELADISDANANADDAAIYAAIDSVKPAGTIVWTQIRN